MSVFLDYLEEAYDNATELRNDQIKIYVMPYLELLIEDKDFTDEEVLEESPQAVQDWFHTLFARCKSCKEWNRVEDLNLGHTPSSSGYCPTCRGE